MSKLAILGNGCTRENTLELQFIKEMKKRDIERALSLEESDYILYITCAGVGDTIYKCLEEIQTLVDYQYQAKKDLKIIIVGCLTEFSYFFNDIRNQENIMVIQNKDWVIPVMNYIMEENKRNTLQTKLKNRTRYFYDSQISAQFFLESGCINHCSFCKTNYSSSKLESIPYEITLNYLRSLIQNGTKNICLSGENTTLYGIDLYHKPILHQLIQELSKEEDLINLSIYELTVQNMYPELLEELITNPKVKHVCIQLESASDKILKLMNRNYTLEEYDKIVSKLRENHKFVNTLLMSGFPGETYEDLDMTIAYLRKRQIFTDFVCQYVDFEFIPSSKLEQLSKLEKRRHTWYLQKAVRECNYEILKNFLPYQTEMVVAGRVDGYTILEGSANVYAISKLKKYQELELGNVVSTPPKKLVRKSKFFNKTIYKYE